MKGGYSGGRGALPHIGGYRGDSPPINETRDYGVLPCL